MSPVARPVASSRPPKNPRTDGQVRPVSAAKDSLPVVSSSRVSSSQLNSISSSLTPLDHELVYAVTRLRLVTGAQLERLFWPGGTTAQGRAARRALKRLTRWRVLDRLPRRVGGVRAGSAGHCFYLGPTGHRLLTRQGSRARRLYEPSDRLVAHTLAIAEAVTRLDEAQRTGDLDIIEIQTEPSCWRNFLGYGGSRMKLRPDLFCRLGCGAYEDRWFLELDMATESRATLAGKARRYIDYFRAGREQAQHGVFPRIVWAAPDIRRCEVIAEVLLGLPREAQRLFAVVTQDELVDYLTREARS